MSDEDLSMFLPAYGDRVALKAWVRRNSTDEAAGNDLEMGSPLLQRLRKKIDAHKYKRVNRPLCNKESADVHHWLTQNRHAEKSTRRVEVGWIHLDRKCHVYKQVKSSRGGGTRHLHLDKTATVQEVLQKAKQLFFPNGISATGCKVQDYTVDVRDFAHCLVSDCSIGQLYERTKLKMLRLYLATKDSEVFITIATCTFYMCSCAEYSGSLIGLVLLAQMCIRHKQ